jgi:hypothetical protein
MFVPTAAAARRRIRRRPTGRDPKRPLDEGEIRPTAARRDPAPVCSINADGPCNGRRPPADESAARLSRENTACH